MPVSSGARACGVAADILGSGKVALDPLGGARRHLWRRHAPAGWLPRRYYHLLDQAEALSECLSVTNTSQRCRRVVWPFPVPLDPLAVELRQRRRERSILRGDGGLYETVHLKFGLPRITVALKSASQRVKHDSHADKMRCHGCRTSCGWGPTRLYQRLA